MQSYDKKHTTCFRVEGMDCPDEVKELRECLEGVDGISEQSFNLMSASMTVTHDPSIISTEDIIDRIRNTGMQASLNAESWRPRRIKATVPRGPLLMMIIAAVGTVVGAILSYVPAMKFHNTTWPAVVAYILAIAAAWRYVLPKAFGSLTCLRLDINVLMTFAVVGAIGLGEWLEGSTVAFLFMVSHVLETWSVNRARRAIQSLMELSPPRARVLRDDGSEEDQDVERIQVGSRIVVRPGEKFPLDGNILEGQTSVNQAPITGEAALISKVPGDEVFAATLNQDGAVTVEITKLAGDTVLAGVIRLVEQAQSQRSRSEQFVDRFARYYTPAVVVGAMALCIIPPLLLAANWSTWFYRSLVLLVIACPCALVISTPIAIVSALAAAARNGVLVKGGEYLEAIGRTKVIAIDKTGTLTAGKPVVQEVIPVNETPAGRLLEIAAAIEQRSEHAIARAIVDYSGQHNVTPPACQDYQAIRGKGARASVNGDEYLIGNHRLLEESKVCTNEMHRIMTEHEDCQHTTVGLASTRDPLGVFLLADGLRAEAKQAIGDLRDTGVERIVMLTGDNAGTAKAIAQECDGLEYRAELLPTDKVSAVEELRRSHKHVVMVGDGINDAPALAAATVGVAMGTVGTDAALETADIALMTDDLRKLPWLLRHSRSTRNIIVQNVAFSLGIKAVFLVLAIPGLANLWMAIAADAGASLLVTFNGLRLLRGPASRANGQSLSFEPTEREGLHDERM
ncbi:MAG: copper-translocating P-type ATPase [Phycisphaerae bacterium]|nr:MAG: copper-translocating P-type ATPase [Phycisphaerae bacterium]